MNWLYEMKNEFPSKPNLFTDVCGSEKAERLRAKLLASSARYYPPERVQFAVLTTLFRLGQGFIDDTYETLGGNGLSQKGGVWRHLTRNRPYDARNDDDSYLGKTIVNSLGKTISVHGPRHLHVSDQCAERIPTSIQLPQSLIRIAGFLHMKTGASQDFGHVHPNERLVINDQNGNSVSRFEVLSHFLATQSYDLQQQRRFKENTLSRSWSG
jgi:hypothetical protein